MRSLLLWRGFSFGGQSFVHRARLVPTPPVFLRRPQVNVPDSWYVAGMSLGGRSPAQVSAVVVVFLVTAAPVWAVVALSSDATASPTLVARAAPSIAIVSSPTIQTLETNVVRRIEARTHTRKTTLVLGTARFTIRVTNTNAVELTNVTVTDPLSPRCSRSIGTLAAGESIAYLCSAANVGRSYTNRVTASGAGGRPSFGHSDGHDQGEGQAKNPPSAYVRAYVHRVKARPRHAVVSPGCQQRSE
jgi:uncharacterized repeat protein (TIGR01451 family)